MRVRRPSLFVAMWVWMAGAMLVGGIVSTVYAPAAPFIGLPGGLACATSYYLWRRQRYVRWLRGDDLLEQSGPSRDVPTTPAT